MKVFVLAPRENWICDRIANEWNNHNSDIITNKMDEADVLWLLAGWCWNQVPLHYLKNKKVVLTVHHIVPQKFDDRKKAEFVFRDQFVDAYHVPNKRSAASISELTQKPIHIIPYWYDGAFWVTQNKQECRNFLNLDTNKFVVGSFQRDTEGGTRNPKLEKGPDILCDFLETLKTQHTDLHVLLGGWRREYVIDRLIKSNINFSYHELVSLEILRNMYSACDLYVVSSRYEGGPQALFEAAAMCVPIVSRDVGLASHILSPNCIFDLPHEFKMPAADDVLYNFEHVKQFKIKSHKNHYIDMFLEVLG